MDPLPHLAAGDLGGGRVLHQVDGDATVGGPGGDGGRAGATQPGVEVAQRHRDVRAQPGRGDPARRPVDGEQVVRGHLDVVAAPVDLVGPIAEDRVEHVAADRYQARMRHPGAIEAVAGLALLVGAHLGQRRLVQLGVAAGDERGHAADRVRAAPVAGAHQQFGVRAHERDGHGHLGPVREDELGPVAEVLDDAEDVVPPAGVESRGVLAQLVQDLLHLERGGDGLDQHGGPDRANRNPEVLLGEDEHLVPQPRLPVALQLRQVEVRPAAGVELPLCTVEEVESEVDQRGRHRPPVHHDVLLHQVPAARPYHDRGESLAERVPLALRGAEVDPPVKRVDEVELPLDDVAPGGRGRVLEVGQPHLGAGVERVDGHLAVRRTGDLDPPVEQTRRRRGDPPRRVGADMCRLRQELRQLAGGVAGAPGTPGVQQGHPPGGELAVQRHQEVQRLRGEDLLVPLAPRAGDLDTHANCSFSVDPRSATVSAAGLSTVLIRSK